MPKVTVTLPDDLVEQIDAKLATGQSRSGWIEEACRAGLVLPPGLAERTVRAQRRRDRSREQVEPIPKGKS